MWSRCPPLARFLQSMKSAPACAVPTSAGIRTSSFSSPPSGPNAMKIVWRVTAYFWERLNPYVLGPLLAWYMASFTNAHKLSIATDLATPIISVFAIIVGFVGAVVTFLLTAQGLPVLTKLKTTRAFHRMIGY